MSHPRSTPRTPLALAVAALALGGCLDTDTDAAPECVPRAAGGELTAALDAYVGPYTVAVQIAEDGTLVGYAVDVGPAVDVDEASARTSAQLAAPHGEPIGADGTLVGVRAGQWLFRYDSADFDLVAVVSAATGHLVLSVGVDWFISGSVYAPVDWAPAEELGCGAAQEVGATDRYEIRTIYSTSIPDAAWEAARASVSRTALLEALSARGTVTSTLVIAIPRFGPSGSTHDYTWVVLVSGVAEAR